MANKLEQLEAKIANLNVQVDELKALLRPMLRERDALLAGQEMQAKLAGMSQAEKAALRQVLQADSIGSEEAFGKIG